MNSNVLAGLAVVGVIGLGLFTYTHNSSVTGPQGSQGPRGEQGPAGRDGMDGSNGANGTSGTDGKITFGATPIIGSPIEVSGASVYYQRVTMRAASTTACSYRGPNATTTVQVVNVNVKNATSTATLWDIGIGATPGATTTVIGRNVSIAASTAGWVMASSSLMDTAGVLPPRILGPNQYINVVYGGGTGGHTSDAPIGSCTFNLLSM